MKILLTGGGTGGPTTPLLAIAQKWRTQDPDLDVEFWGTGDGPEREWVDALGIRFQTIPAGKFRRYFSPQNFFDVWNIFRAFFISFGRLSRHRPDLMLSAGSFVSVPVAWACAVMRIPVAIHQQDVRPGLANRLMAPIASLITTALTTSLHHFPKQKTMLVGNPVRQDILEGSTSRAIERFDLRPDLPTVLILGGGTGALALNKIVMDALPKLLSRMQIIHVAGRGKNIFQHPLFHETHRPTSFDLLDQGVKQKSLIQRYHVVEFLTEEMNDALAIATIVVTRAGMATLSELAALKKAAVIVPLPESHQAPNADYFQKHGAAVVLSQKTLTAQILVQHLLALLDQPSLRQSLEEQIGRIMKPNATENIVAELRDRWMKKR
jgi:UDP-N-acetylglucosamine--N-acetylmuramyl-(pentapeptide) pyrophosphoryl-undecaprenol N-acetylglucosamine transferase